MSTHSASADLVSAFVAQPPKSFNGSQPSPSLVTPGLACSDAGRQPRVLLLCSGTRWPTASQGVESMQVDLEELSRTVERQLIESGAVCDRIALDMFETDCAVAKGAEHHQQLCSSGTGTADDSPSVLDRRDEASASDWIGQVYARFMDAQGLVVIAPANWSEDPSPLKAFIQQLVASMSACRDPDARSGNGFGAWSYPPHLSGRVYDLLICGRSGIRESARRELADWLDWIGLFDAHAVPDTRPAGMDKAGVHDKRADGSANSPRPLTEAECVSRCLMSALEALSAGKLARPYAPPGNPFLSA